MTTPPLDAQYWNERYLNRETGWDTRGPSSPLTHYIDGLLNRDIGILIPGCGNAYEAIYLLDKGFHRVTLLDIAPVAVEQLRQKFWNTSVTVVEGDFFTWQDKQYDLILEQTFFCAIDPTLRSAYAQHMARLLKPGGTLAGVLFNRDFEQAGPPFGGSEAEYRNLFTPHFTIHHLEACYNSIAPRAGSELFIELSPLTPAKNLSA